jgi:hypothetical protein
MVAYEFYRRDPIRGDQLIGLLPERRRNPANITKESVLNWGEKYFCNNLNTKDIYFIQVTIDENTVRTLQLMPLFVTQQEVNK